MFSRGQNTEVTWKISGSDPLLKCGSRCLDRCRVFYYALMEASIASFRPSQNGDREGLNPCSTIHAPFVCWLYLQKEILYVRFIFCATSQAQKMKIMWKILSLNDRGSRVIREKSLWVL